jgi:hypothetical protein
MTKKQAVDEAITKLAESCKIWIIGAGRQDPVRPQNTFREATDRNGRGTSPSFLRYQERASGINLGWAEDRTVGGDIGRPDSRTWWGQAEDQPAWPAEEAVVKLVMSKLKGC